MSKEQKSNLYRRLSQMAVQSERTVPSYIPEILNGKISLTDGEKQELHAFQQEFLKMPKKMPLNKMTTVPVYIQMNDLQAQNETLQQKTSEAEKKLAKNREEMKRKSEAARKKAKKLSDVLAKQAIHYRPIAEFIESHRIEEPKNTTSVTVNQWAYWFVLMYQFIRETLQYSAYMVSSESSRSDDEFPVCVKQGQIQIHANTFHAIGWITKRLMQLVKTLYVLEFNVDDIFEQVFVEDFDEIQPINLDSIKVPKNFPRKKLPTLIKLESGVSLIDDENKEETTEITTEENPDDKDVTIKAEEKKEDQKEDESEDEKEEVAEAKSKDEKDENTEEEEEASPAEKAAKQDS